MIWEAFEEDAVRVRPTSGGLSEWRFAESDRVLCSERSTGDGSRAIVSRERVARGVRVHRELATAFVTTACAVCLLPAKRICSCGTRWCSFACQKRDDDHPCAALDLLRRLQAEDDSKLVDFDALRLVTRLWTAGMTKNKSFLRLCDHHKLLVKSARAGDAGAERALASAHVGATLAAQALRCDDEPHLVLSLLKIRFNAFPFVAATVDGSSSLALFLSASAFNHSCAPNTTLSIHPSTNETETTSLVLEARTHVEVERGTELTISYLSLSALLHHGRRDALRDSFFFDCKCQKCSTSHGECNEELKNRALDRAAEDLAECLETKDARRAREASRRIEAVFASVDAGGALEPARAKLRLVAAKALLDASPREALKISVMALEDVMIACGPRDLATRLAAKLAALARSRVRDNE